MLNKQRDRYKPIIDKRNFARNFVVVHFLSGLIMTALLVFHELWVISIGVFLWYLLSVGLVAGMMRRQEWCRLLLGLMFLLLAVASAVFITAINPTLTMDHEPMLSRNGLPLWGAAVTMGYFVGGVMAFASDRIKRATTLGFELW